MNKQIEPDVNGTKSTQSTTSDTDSQSLNVQRIVKTVNSSPSLKFGKPFKINKNDGSCGFIVCWKMLAETA